MVALQPFSIGSWLVDPAAGRISSEGELRLLEPKVMDLLVALASDSERVHSREDLLERLWPQVTVGDESLARCVFKLRKALSDDASAPRYIETIAKRGYRLIAPVRPAQIPPRLTSTKSGVMWLPEFGWRAAAGIALIIFGAFAAGHFLRAPEIGIYPARAGTQAASDEERLRRVAEDDRSRTEGVARPSLR